MNKKKEKGIINIDYVVAIIIFVAGSVAVLGLYYNIYLSISKIRVDQRIIAHITEICEMIDLQNFENVDTVEEVDSIIESAEIPENYYVKCIGIENYNNYAQGDERNCVERVNLLVSYSIDGYEREYTVSKVKIKE